VLFVDCCFSALWVQVDAVHDARVSTALDVAELEMESPIRQSAGIALGAGTGQSFPLVMAIGATMASLPGNPECRGTTGAT
jgi:hypothetical protein